MHPVREAAEIAYQAAIAANDKAMTGASESVYALTHAVLKAARVAVVKAELAYPTQKETERMANKKRLRDRGLDV